MVISYQVPGSFYSGCSLYVRATGSAFPQLVGFLHRIFYMTDFLCNFPRLRSVGFVDPGKGMGVLQNFQNFRIRVWTCRRTS